MAKLPDDVSEFEDDEIVDDTPEDEQNSDEIREDRFVGTDPGEYEITRFGISDSDEDDEAMIEGRPTSDGVVYDLDQEIDEDE